MSQSPNPAMALLEFERRIQSSQSNREVAFRAVNDGSQVLRFDQAVLWRYDVLGRPMIAVASGLADVSVDSPFQQWLVRLVQAIAPEEFSAPQSLSAEELPDAALADGEEWCPAHLLHCPLRGPTGAPLGGMLYFRNEPFTEAERALAEWMARSTGYGLWAWRSERHALKRWLKARSTWKVIGTLVAVVALAALIPVNMSALAPAEITPLRPIPVTSPMDGVVRDILVQPNQNVKADQVVAVLEDTALRNRLEVAVKALDIARADLQRATFKSFADEASRLELQVLNARVQEKATEVAYLNELLARSKLQAPQGGLAIFSSQEDWRGRPVQVGERVMVIADPSLVDVTVYLPPEDAVELEAGARVDVLLHVDPLSPLQAQIERASYEASAQADGTLAYVVRARLADGQALPRIGLRGTAKIYAGQVTLGYYLLRKPIAYVRRSLGV
ncbi:MAG TPA: HlyD family efflux transporter periplasmic adaptor subunit [Burkholderiales bacterium]|nr:HlyD family efflux transporter periplasmic adaptor subunit [Burkholderiales bacterium]